MRRSIEQAFLALRQQILAWARGEVPPDVRVFVYPPEWEAMMLARFPAFAEACTADGAPAALVDVGQLALAEVERRPGLVERLTSLEADAPERVRHDLSVLAGRAVLRVLKAPLEPPVVCRLLVNTGALGTVVSYSAITNDLFGSEPGAAGVSAPAVLAFPGEGDDRSLNLLGLRADTNYRVPRI